MGDGEEIFGFDTDGAEEEKKEGRYYLGDGLWTHPETGGDFTFSNPADNR